MNGAQVHPNFFIVGAAKCGTTTLADILNQHPDAFIPKVKEPGFFCVDEGIDKKSEYLRLFQPGANAVAIGEASTSYLFDEMAAEKIHATYPNAKIICSFRNPIDMAFSFWRYRRAISDERLSFVDAVSPKTQQERRSEAFKASARPTWKAYAYVDRGQYARQLRHYLRVFDRSQIHVMIFEEFLENPSSHIADLYRFLEIDESFKPDLQQTNPGGEPRFEFIRKIRNRRYPLLRRLLPFWLLWRTHLWLGEINRSRSATPDQKPSRALRAQLAIEFRDDVRQLEALLNRRLDCWHDFFAERGSVSHSQQL